MSTSDLVSHFWVAADPLFSTTLFVAPPPGGSVQPNAQPRTTTALEVYDVDGTKINSVEVEFPSTEVGVVQLEPFLGGLKMQSGVRHGHLAVSSPSGSRQLCRHALQQHVSIIQEPMVVRSRESCFVPLVIGGQRQHMVALVNAGHESAQISLRLFYAQRSPEWNLTVPAHGSRLVVLESELLIDADEKAWEKGPVQAYVRLSARHQTFFTCQIFERVLGEQPEQETFRCVTSW